MIKDNMEEIEKLLDECATIPGDDDLAFIAFFERKEQFIRSLDQNEPNHRSLLITLLGGYGISLQRCDRHTKALEVIPEAIELVKEQIELGDYDPELHSFRENLHWSRGVCFYDTGKHAAASAVFEHLVAQEPDNALYNTWLNAARTAPIRKWRNRVWLVLLIWVLLEFSVFKLAGRPAQLYLSLFGFTLLVVAVVGEVYLYLLKNRKASSTSG